MKNTFIYSSIFISLAFLISCYKSDSNESIASDATFAGFLSWKLEATTKGSSPSLGEAHLGNDSTVTRKVYFKNGQNKIGDSYPIGTVIVKQAKNASGIIIETVAMVKRGNNFNSTVGNWEWFMLDTEGKIAKNTSGSDLRGGASLMNGMCNGCHGKAGLSKDFVFTK